MRDCRQHNAEVDDCGSLVILPKRVIDTTSSTDGFRTLSFEHFSLFFGRLPSSRPCEHLLLDKVRVVLPDEVDQDCEGREQRGSPQFGG